MIELEDVHKSFGKVEVLKGISASIAKSEVVCIIGPSGSGKSTILRCINGLESYDRGDIRIEGISVDRNAPSRAGCACAATSFTTCSYCRFASGRRAYRRLTNSSL